LEIRGGKMKRQYTAVYIKDGKWYLGFCVEIAGCVTQGRTLSSCRNNLLDAVQLMLECNAEEMAKDINTEMLVEGLVAGETKDIERMFEKSRMAINKRRRKTFDLGKPKWKTNADTKTYGNQ
jgi:predicted RNase H-like HicB family nuclease